MDRRGGEIGMASFDIRTPADLLNKLIEEQGDFKKSHCLSRASRDQRRDVEECGIPARRGGNWSAVQVARVLEALPSLSTQASQAPKKSG
jgi:hypothetical protein